MTLSINQSAENRERGKHTLPLHFKPLSRDNQLLNKKKKISQVACSHFKDCTFSRKGARQFQVCYTVHTSGMEKKKDLYTNKLGLTLKYAIKKQNL